MIEKYNNKKRIFIFLGLFLFGSLAFAMPPLNVDASSDMWNNNWDLPIVESLVYFGGSLFVFMNLAAKICVFLFFLNICWHSFKLWFGVIEIKKVAIDMLYKYILVTVLMTIYPSVVDGVFSLATNIGVGATNSATYLTNNITATFTASYNATLTSMKAIKMALADEKLKNIKPEDLKKMSKALAMSPEELEDEFKKVYSNYKTTNEFSSMEDFWESKNSNKEKWWAKIPGATTVVALRDSTKKKDERKRTYQKLFTDAFKDYDLENMIVLFDTFNSSFGMGDINESLVASIMDNSKSSEDLDVAIQVGETEIANRIKSYFTSPYMDIPYVETIKSHDGKKTLQGINTFRTNILSPSQMLRIGVMLAKVVENKGKIGVEKHQNRKGEQEGLTASSNILNFTEIKVQELFETIIKFIFPYLMLLPIIICIVNYIVCVLEYYFVTSIGILFVPLLLFDPTKQYGSKLLYLFFSYFMKVLTITVITYFCLGFLLKSGTYLMLNPDTFGFQSVAYGLFIFVLSLIMSQHGPEIGQILLTGNPALSSGSVANVGRQMGHAMQMGMHAAHNVKRGATAAGKAAVHGGENAVNMMQRRAAVFGAAKDLYNTKRENGAGRFSSFASAAGFAAKTDTKMAAQDFMEKTKQKIGYNSNINKDKTEFKGGIGSMDGQKNKIGLQDNKEAMQARAKNARDIAIAGMDKTDDKA